MSQLDKLKNVIEPVVTDEGLILWGVDYRQGRGNCVLCVYIDSLKGIDVEDCANVSRQLSVVLDVENIIQSEYRLEISSPGTSRFFFSLAQYTEYLGQTVKVKLRSSFEGRRKIQGVLSQVNLENSELSLIDGEEEYVLPYELIDRGQLIAV